MRVRVIRPFGPWCSGQVIPAVSALMAEDLIRRGYVEALPEPTPVPAPAGRATGPEPEAAVADRPRRSARR